MLRSVVRLLALTTALAQSLEGQVVRGVARDADTDRLIESGVVTLLDENGSSIRAVLTDSLGRFGVLAPAAGAYRLRFERLGYKPVTTDRFNVKAGETTSRTLKPTAVSVSLAEIVVTDRPRCRILGEADT
ncbi:MAG: carboxypeptidase-like regulatory domain-containing protein, partial [Gemmatimonadota bacterium]|nr:carboxypeptidase-like regulatory domain-containing protein [Gemmatimonadota bacterium]